MTLKITPVNNQYTPLLLVLIRNGLYNVQGFAASKIQFSEINSLDNPDYLARKLSLIPFNNQGDIKIHIKGKYILSNLFVDNTANIRPIFEDIIVWDAMENEPAVDVIAELQIMQGKAKDSAKFNNWYNISIIDNVIVAKSDLEYTIQEIKEAVELDIN